MASIVVLRCKCGELVTSHPLDSAEYIRNPKYGSMFIDFRPCNKCGSILSTTAAFLNATKRFIIVQQRSYDMRKVVKEIECL